MLCAYVFIFFFAKTVGITVGLGLVMSGCFIVSRCYMYILGEFSPDLSLNVEPVSSSGLGLWGLQIQIQTHFLIFTTHEVIRPPLVND